MPRNGVRMSKIKNWAIETMGEDGFEKYLSEKMGD